jgi:HAD superfamily hydrolase (TIGR01509 family)
MNHRLPPDTQLVIFDCDGVLVDSEPIANRVMAEALSDQGWPMSGDAAMARFKGGHMHQVHAALETHLGLETSRDWIVQFDADVAQALESVQAVDGIRALIDRVHESGRDSCVASQGPHAKMAVTLRAAGLAELFTGRIFSSTDVARPKPAPDLFLHAARSCGVTPAQTVVIEDSATGVTAARAAGMGVFYLNALGQTLDGAITLRHPDALSP